MLIVVFIIITIIIIYSLIYRIFIFGKGIFTVFQIFCIHLYFIKHVNMLSYKKNKYNDKNKFAVNS